MSFESDAMIFCYIHDEVLYSSVTKAKENILANNLGLCSTHYSSDQDAQELQLVCLIACSSTVIFTTNLCIERC